MNGIIIPLKGAVGSFTFQWNPTEVSEGYSAAWVPIKVAGRALPYQQYSNGEEETLEFTLRFSSSGDAGFVKEQLKKLKDLMKPTENLSGMKAQKPLQVRLGSDINGKYVLKQMRSRKHTYADGSLSWFYADANLSFSKYEQ